MLVSLLATAVLELLPATAVTLLLLPATVVTLLATPATVVMLVEMYYVSMSDTIAVVPKVFISATASAVPNLLFCCFSYSSNIRSVCGNC